MIRILVLVILFDCTLVSGQGPLSLCEVMKNQSEYMHRNVSIRGIVISFEHGMYLEAASRCDSEDIFAIRLEDVESIEPYFKAGGRKGSGIPATVHGRLVMSELHFPRIKRHLAISVKNIQYDKSRSVSK